jgi:hypothetical protein
MRSGRSAILQELVEAIGPKPAILLCRRFGGRDMRIPLRAHDTHPIALAIGIEAARSLSEQFGAMLIQIPAETTALLMARDMELVRRYREGASIRELGKVYGYSRPWVSKILRRYGIESNDPREV